MRNHPLAAALSAHLALPFLLYKRRSQVIGFPANENWFRTEFRAKYEKAK